MTPAAIIALVRDALLILGVGFVVFWIWRDGRNGVKVADMAAVQQQITANASQEAAWHAQRDAAEVKHAQDIQSVTALISAHNQPIIVRIPTSSSPVPGTASPSAGIHPSGGGADPGPGVNIRPDVQGFESKYELALANCRSALAQWP